MELVSTRKIYVVMNSFGCYDSYYERIVGITFDRSVAERLKEREEKINYVISEKDLKCPVEKSEEIVHELVEIGLNDAKEAGWISHYLDGNKEILQDKKLTEWFREKFGYEAEDVLTTFLNEKKSYEEYNSTDIKEKDYYE